MQSVQELHRMREKGYVILELYVWGVISLSIIASPFIDILSGIPAREVFQHYINSFIFAFLLLLFPVMFRLVFGHLPMEAARRWRGNKYTVELYKGNDGAGRTESSRPVQGIGMVDLSSVEILALLAQNSQKLSVSIYTRAGVYLIVGVFVAFTGLAFFYSQTAVTFSEGNWLNSLAIIAPKLGILIFIQTIAFFFLRQYRSAMDEFRYFESIKRNREETFALFVIASSGSKEVDVIGLAKDLPFYSQAKALGKDQTTEIIEARKLEKNEIELLEKIIEAVSINKK